MGDKGNRTNKVVYRTDKKPINRDLWEADHRARCPECTGFSTTMAYSALNTCENLACPVDIFEPAATDSGPDVVRNGYDLDRLLDRTVTIQVGPRLKRGEQIKQVRARVA